MVSIRSLIRRLVRLLFGLFGWRGQRALITLRDRLDPGLGSSPIPPQPWQLAPGFPADSVTLATVAPPPPSPVVQPTFVGRPQPPLIAGKPFDQMRVLHRHLRRLPDALVLPGQVVLDAITGAVVPYPILAGEAHPHNNLRVWPDGRMTAWSPLSRRAAVTIDRPVFLADTSHHIYGHVLLEVMPRLLLLEHCPPDTPILTVVGMEGPYPAMFAAMGVDPTRVVPLAGPTLCRSLYLGDNFVDLRNFVAPQAWQAFARLARLGETSTIASADRLYVSRRGVARRPLANEAEIEALFARRGFTIVNPEALSFADQVCLFSRARIIAGPGGSALHNMVFSRPDTRILILAVEGLVLAIDTLLTRPGGSLTYVLGASTNPRKLYEAPWTIEPWEVEAAIDQLVG